jgi:hypothetical protein
MVSRTEALRAGGHEELGYETSHRQRHSDLLCGRQDDAEVLVVRINPEPGRELAVKHRRGQSSGLHRNGRLDVNIARLQQQQGLTDEFDDPAHQELIGGLDDLTRTCCADVSNGLVQCVQNGQGSGEVLSRSPTMIERVALMAPGSPPETGASRVPHPGLPCGLGDEKRPVRPDSAHVYKQQSRTGMRENALLTWHDLFDVWRIGQHGNQDVRLSGDSREARCAAAALPDQLGGGLGSPAVNDDVIASLTRFAAIGRPMIPSPTKPMVVIPETFSVKSCAESVPEQAARSGCCSAGVDSRHRSRPYGDRG